jgi:hypothetical protein
VSDQLASGLKELPREYFAPWWGYAMFLALGFIMFGTIYVSGKNGAWWFVAIIGAGRLILHLGLRSLRCRAQDVG